MPHKTSEELSNSIALFESLDAKYQTLWADFEERHGIDLMALDQAREDRNSALDVAVRAVREETDQPTFVDKTLKISRFSAVKKGSKVFYAEMMITRLRERDLFSMAKTAGALEEHVVIKYEPMKAFLEERKIYGDFEDCEDYQPLTTAVTGPKPIAPFGGEVKKK